MHLNTADNYLTFFLFCLVSKKVYYRQSPTFFVHMCVIGARKSSKNLKNVAVGHTKEVDNGFASLVYNVARILTI